jgi:hypothetical protein
VMTGFGISDPVVGSCEHGNEPSSPQLSASQNELFSMELERVLDRTFFKYFCVNKITREFVTGEGPSPPSTSSHTLHFSLKPTFPI